MRHGNAWRCQCRHEVRSHPTVPRSPWRSSMPLSLTRLTVKLRILLVAALPVVGLIFAAAMIVSERLSALSSARHVQFQSEMAVYLGDVIHELQRERGASAVFLGSKGAKMGAELDQQRAATDRLRTELTGRMGALVAASRHEELTQAVSRATAAVAALDGKRQEISSQAILAPSSSAYFTETIRQLIAVVTEMAKEIDDAEAVATLSGFLGLTNAKERAGQERAIGAAGFAAGQFDTAQHRALVAAVSAQDAFIATFNNFAADRERERFAKTVTGTAVDEVLRMREVALLAGPGRDVSNVDAAAWFKATTARIDLLKQVENFIAANLAEQAKQDISAAMSMLWFTLGVALLLVALASAVGWAIARGVSRPLTSIEDAMGKLAAGDKAIEIPGLARTDEIGDMAKAVQVFKENAVQMERMEEERRERERRQIEDEREAERKRAEAERRGEDERRMAQRDAEEREAQARQRAEKQAQEARKKAMLELAERLERAVMGVAQGVSASASQLQSTARSMSELARGTDGRCTSLAATSTQTAQNVSKVAGAADQLSASVAEITQRVGESARIAARAVEEAKSTNATVKGLAEAARRIGEVVSLINDIAAQTNLLALNATIEAARAGESGKGFAVVASEVKTLANQTAKATEDISSQIAAIQSATDDAVGAIESIGSTIGEISHIATVVAGAIE
ncbi:MAG: HAMP domain-containing protein, partial [Alphaproteobacteria bacterium]|nr:HAMP domain-containing protein [Alphaproteobacteria bacterium]